MYRNLLRDVYYNIYIKKISKLTYLCMHVYNVSVLNFYLTPIVLYYVQGGEAHISRLVIIAAAIVANAATSQQKSRR